MSERPQKGGKWFIDTVAGGTWHHVIQEETYAVT